MKKKLTLVLAFGLLPTTGSGQFPAIEYRAAPGVDPLSIAYLQSPAISDDFVSGGGCNSIGLMGELGWNLAAIAGTCLAAEADHPGIWRGSVAATATGYLELRKDVYGMRVENVTAVKAILRFASGANVPDSRFGLVSVTGFPASTGSYFEHLAADTNWFAVNKDGAGTNRIDTTVAFAAGSWVTMEIRPGTASAVFLMNGAAVATNATNYSPTTLAVNPTVVHKTNGTASTVDIDFFAMRLNAVR